MRRIQTVGKLRAAVSSSRELLMQSPEFKRRAVHCMRHSWKIHALSKALAQALADSREASTWPGQRLAVSFQISEQVELLTQRIQVETEAAAASYAALRNLRRPAPC
ncbi:hypothetical protein [Arthrobacter sp. Soil736]|uniref:hypothetical protein n=1 Tax=Arthrobacter sp. Soil736 TaxID=1736395 RepID=UPI0012FAF85A|nr:hypothetical protein [Arthrobacter sp. Soil736]